MTNKDLKIKDIKGEKLKKKEEPKLKKKQIEGVKGIIRVMETNLDGTKKISHALLGIKGVGQSLSQVIMYVSGISPELLAGSLTDEQIEKIEDIIRNPLKHNIPKHMLNRRLDPTSGKDKHIAASELTLSLRSDIDTMKKIRSYKGIRHGLRLPVRGQKTRSSFRRGAKVGVVRKAIREKKKGKK